MNPYKWALEQYINNPPNEVCEERDKNMHIALVQMMAWEEGYKASQEPLQSTYSQEKE